MTRTAYNNQHIKEHYDRINFVIPKGEKDRIKKICSEIGASVNEYLYMLVCNDLADGTSTHLDAFPLQLSEHDADIEHRPAHRG